MTKDVKLLKVDPAEVVSGGSVITTAEVDQARRGSLVAVWDSKGIGTFEAMGKGEIGAFKVAGESEIAVTTHPRGNPKARWDTNGVKAPDSYKIAVRVFKFGGDLRAFLRELRSALESNEEDEEGDHDLDDALGALEEGNDDSGVEHIGDAANNVLVTQPVVDDPGVQRVRMLRTEVTPTSDQALWSVIRASSERLSFQNYSRFMDIVLGGDLPLPGEPRRFRLPGMEGRIRPEVKARLRLPFPDVDAYRQLKVATEVFMMINCGVAPQFRGIEEDLSDESGRFGRALRPGEIEREWQRLLDQGQAISGDEEMLPYLALVRRKLKDVEVVAQRKRAGVDDPDGILQREEASAQIMEILLEKLTYPCFLELIWSYWHEEGMLVQSMNAISMRFQNRRRGADGDPLAMLEIDPLRSLNNFIWGYIQDEQHRLSVLRRVYEYDHHYGLTLLGRAVPSVRGADSRSRFIEALHRILHLCSLFFREDDDTTVVADGFPLLHALREVHLLLTQGAHNQYGDLPWTARQEMLIEQWLLARPEFREFLPRRIMVDYPEEWMDSVETMKTLQGWTTSSILHFNELARFGERILLGVRFGAWPSIFQADQAANWARYWRPEIQGYIHAYRAVTGVDLTERQDATLPALLLRKRLPQWVGQPLPAARGRRGLAARSAQPTHVVQVPVPSELQEWSELNP